MSSGFLPGPTAIKRRIGLAAPVPVAGASIVNGDFSSWTGDNPTGWTVTGEFGADPMVTQVVGGARFYTSAGFLSAKQTGLFARGDWIFESITATKVAGEIAIRDETHTNNYLVLTASGSFLQVRRNGAAYTGIALTRNATPTDWTVASIASHKLMLASLFSTRTYASADCDLSAAITRTERTQAGFVARLDSATSPANFIIAYLDGAGNVKVDKCVAGVYTTVISGAVTYGSTKILRLVCSGNNVSAYYDGTQVGSTVTVSDAGIVSNTRHGLFSTYASNSFAGYVAA